MKKVIVDFKKIGVDGNRTMFMMSYKGVLKLTVITVIVIPKSIFSLVEKEVRVRFNNDNSVWFRTYDFGKDRVQVHLIINDAAELAQFLLWTRDGIEVEIDNV